MDISDINLFDQNVGTACAEVRLRCTWISLVLIYLNKMWEWHVPKLGLDVHGYYWYCGYVRLAICFKPFGFLLYYRLRLGSSISFD